jgi:diaminohydroxyphosphoribosylaminopyrimidine deaminase/5-amino-6-(5-phosphoribosylamino)uracil reductase
MQLSVFCINFTSMPHEQYMRRCLELAQSAGGNAAPNPMVGAVLVHQGRIIGEGFHRQYGTAHAETNCIDSVLPDDRALIPASTLYVSLEPCAHFGNTPPCASRIIQEGISKVVIANSDPFEKVNGNGIQLLTEAGVDVTTGICAKEGRWLNRRFFQFHERQRPYIVLKWAATADGYIAPADRSRVAISNTYSQCLVHRWRTEETAIIVGYRTALGDNPRLTARFWDGPQPLRIVMDRNLQLPKSHHLFNEESTTWIINEQRDSSDGHIRHLQFPFNEDLLPMLLGVLHQHKKLSLLVEGGTDLLQRFINANLWDEARVFTAEHTLQNGIPAPGLKHAILANTIQLDSDTLQVFLHKDNPFAYSDFLGF